MSRKGKEPAGLRRWRLAHKKHRRVRRLKTRVVRTVARRRRYGRKGKGRRGSKAIPLLMLAPVVPGFMAAWNARGGGPFEAGRQGIYAVSGIDVKGESGGVDMNRAYKTLGLVIVGMIGHKVATKVGINRQLKKLTMGYIQL
jgi:hypothetical protein